MSVDMSALSRMQTKAFFENAISVTQEQCDSKAKEISSKTVVSPTTCQGGSSYTVASGAMVIQFRAPGSFLDMNLMRCIEKAYLDFVPRHQDCGPFGSLRVYAMNNMGGESMYLARDLLYKDDYKLLRNTIDSYAKFYVSAYHNMPVAFETPDRGELFQTYLSRLQQLREGLPDRFHALLDTLITHLPRLFDQTWPLVPNHTDLLENNIHVNPKTGTIMGICDWRDAEISPFGMSLGGLETMLGVRAMNENGWTYHPNYRELRDQFWATFYRHLGTTSEAQWQCIETARLTGLFIANGFVQGEHGSMAPATEDSLDLRFLGAVVLT